MKNIFLLFLLLISLILVGCNDKEATLTDSSGINGTIEVDVNTNSESCLARWDCVNSKEKAYLNENCAWTNQTTCELGCREGDCERPPTCEEGWACLNDELRGYRNPDCSWSNKYACDYGCADTLCRLEPVNETVDTPQENEPPATSTSSPFFTLEQGQTNQHLVGEENYNVTLYFITEGKIKLDVNGDKSDWLVEDDNYQYQNLNLTINSILYSQYSLQQVEYEIN